jgi:hypothetical protein
MFYVTDAFEIEKFRAAPMSQWPLWFSGPGLRARSGWHYNAKLNRAVPANRCFKTQKQAIDFIVDEIEDERTSRRLAIEQLTKQLKRLKLQWRIRSRRRILKQNHDRLRELKQIKERLTCGA